MKTLLLPLFLLLSAHAQAGSFACVHNHTNEIAAMVLEGGGTVADFTVNPNESYCHEFEGGTHAFQLSLRGGVVYGLVEGEWTTISYDSEGHQRAVMEGKEKRSLKENAGIFSILVFFTLKGGETAVIAQDGNASHCAEARPYRWEGLGKIETTIRYDTNRSGNCFFEPSYIYLNFFNNGHKIVSFRCTGFECEPKDVDNAYAVRLSPWIYDPGTNLYVYPY